MGRMSEGNTCMGNIPTAWDPLWMCCMYLHEECFPCGWHSQWAGEESRSVEITGLMMESSVKCNFPGVPQTSLDILSLLLVPLSLLDSGKGR